MGGRCFDVGFPRPGRFRHIRTAATTSQSTNSAQSITVPIPANAKGLKVTVNTGQCSFKRTGRKLSLNASGGSPSGGSTDNKTVTVTQGPQASSSFPSTYTYISDGYSGVLAAGTPYVISGTAGDSKAAIYTEGPRTTAELPFDSTLSYTLDGYSGTLTASTPYVISGTDAGTKKVTVTEGPQASNSFPATYSYSDADGYSGLLSPGTPYAVSGTAADSKSKTVCKDFSNRYGMSTMQIPDAWAYSDDDGYTGTLSASGNPAIVSGSLLTKYVTVVKNDNEGDSINYDDGAYSGTLKMVDHSNGVYTYYGQVSDDTTIYAQYYTGTVSRPDTRQWECDYTGNVSKSDTRYWECHYTGTIYRGDTRQWDCDYTGVVYGPTTYYYQYIFTIAYSFIKYPSFPVYPTHYNYFMRPF